MAPRIITALFEIFIVVVLLGVFSILIGKYFFTEELRAAPEQARSAITMELAYRQAKSDYEYFPTPKTFKAEGNANSIPILVYHGLAETEYKSDVLAEEFKEHMFALKKAGYETITMDEFEQFMRGEEQLPAKSFLLTFDDGIKTSYYHADPVLRVTNYTAVMFTISQQALKDKSRYYLTRDEVKEMQASGRWEIEAHAKDAHNLIQIGPDGEMGHFLSNRKWFPAEERYETVGEFRERISTEFRDAKTELDEGFGVNTENFAFPFGDYGQNTHNFANAQHVVWEEVHKVFPRAYYQSWPSRGFTFNYAAPTEYKIKRITVYRETSGTKLLNALARGTDKSLPHHDNLTHNRGWVPVWGTSRIHDEKLELRPDGGVSGALAFLDGTALWREYDFQAHVKSFDSQSLSLLGMFNDNENYLSCDFYDCSVSVRQVTHNDTITLATTPASQSVTVPRGDAVLGIRISENKIACSVGGETVITAEQPENSRKTGGIGFKVTDPAGRYGGATIHSVTVDSASFVEGFDEPRVVEGTGNPGLSTDFDWWVNSGGAMIQQNGVGSTLRGPANQDTEWQLAYADHEDTESGAYPQNIFRLITRSTWKDATQQVRFRILDYRASDSPHRNESNGVLLFSRYADGDNLYYAGVRVDGAAVIKKKSYGEYHELAYKQVFPGAYDLAQNPNLLPLNTWMGLKTETFNKDGSVHIRLYLDRHDNGNWELITEGVDSPDQHGPEILHAAHAGIRTDFMDVEFDDYRVNTS